MSADYSTEHFKGWHHRLHGGDWIHVAYRNDDGHALGDFSREEITELVHLAGQAWPGLAEDLADAASARAALEAREDEDAEHQPASVTVVSPVTEYGIVTSGGGIRIRNAFADPDVDRIYPLTNWVAGKKADGAMLMARTILVLDDWGPIPP